MSLLGRKILIVGGNGFVGNYVAAKLIDRKANVSILSRKGPKYEHPQNQNIDWLIGNILKPSKYLDHINEADTIIHTVGTLIDSSVKGSKPGDSGTYQQINKQTFVSLLNSLKSKKKIIYLSSNAHPPFLQRYLTTKHEAEKLLFQSIHQGYTLRPGFIYDWKFRKWSIPLRYNLQMWNKIYPYIHSIAPEQSYLQKLIGQFRQGDCTSLQDLCQSILQIINEGSQQKIIENKQIKQLSIKYSQNNKIN